MRLLKPALCGFALLLAAPLRADVDCKAWPGSAFWAGDVARCLGAGADLNAKDDSGMQDGENCSMRSTQGRASQLNEINCTLDPASCVHKVAWYLDRDNSMSPVSSEEGVGAAMAIAVTKSGYSQAVQVCPGVYLATAHGILDDPEEAQKQNRTQDSPSENIYGISPYPLSEKTVMTAKNDSSYLSPRIKNPSAWRDPQTNYVFIKVDNPLNPNHFIRPVRASD
ncbi:MAG: hypothetical protein GDA41_07455 [Rhodospirillales bacterium]|nr:hypothetical protein [Rhodospirillales bacterium]